MMSNACSTPDRRATYYATIVQHNLFWTNAARMAEADTISYGHTVAYGLSHT